MCVRVLFVISDIISNNSDLKIVKYLNIFCVVFKYSEVSVYLTV